MQATEETQNHLRSPSSISALLQRKKDPNVLLSAMSVALWFCFCLDSGSTDRKVTSEAPALARSCCDETEETGSEDASLLTMFATSLSVGTGRRATSLRVTCCGCRGHLLSTKSSFHQSGHNSDSTKARNCFTAQKYLNVTVDMKFCWRGCNDKCKNAHMLPNATRTITQRVDSYDQKRYIICQGETSHSVHTLTIRKDM